MDSTRSLIVELDRRGGKAKRFPIEYENQVHYILMDDLVERQSIRIPPFKQIEVTTEVEIKDFFPLHPELLPKDMDLQIRLRKKGNKTEDYFFTGVKEGNLYFKNLASSDSKTVKLCIIT